jgi:hypothetical protein
MCHSNKLVFFGFCQLFLTTKGLCCSNCTRQRLIPLHSPRAAIISSKSLGFLSFFSQTYRKPPPPAPAIHATSANPLSANSRLNSVTIWGSVLAAKRFFNSLYSAQTSDGNSPSKLKGFVGEIGGEWNGTLKEHLLGPSGPVGQLFHRFQNVRIGTGPIQQNFLKTTDSKPP